MVNLKMSEKASFIMKKRKVVFYDDRFAFFIYNNVTLKRKRENNGK